MEIFTASRQWATRPADERFPSIQAMHDACVSYRGSSAVAVRPYADLIVQASGDEIQLVGKAGNPATMTNWAFGQLCGRVAAPAGFLRDLSAPLAASVINERLRTTRESDDNASMLFHRNGNLVVRSFNSEMYSRIWNSDITGRLLQLQSAGPWQPAPAAMDGSRGLYASDHDMFAFLVDNDRRVFEKHPTGGLSRGFLVWNSEVGASKFGGLGFLYNYICANHIIWGASQTFEFGVVHKGNADVRGFQQFRIALREYADSAASLEEAKITRAMSFDLGGDKAAVLDKVFALRVPELSRVRIAKAYDLAEEHTDWYGSPRSAWGMSNGLTQLSQDSQYADDRTAIDRAAGKVLDLAF